MLDALKRSPPYRLARSTKNRLARIYFERGFSDTGTPVSSAELGHADTEFVAYEPSAWGWLRRALRGRAINERDVLLDIGSGKGRVLLQAARRYRFARVTGVEISEPLAAFARANIEANRQRLRAGDVEVITADAVEFEIPDDTTFVYLFSPFTGTTFHRVLANIIASLDRRPRPLTLIYANPVMADAVAQSGRFELVETLKRPLRPDIGERGWVKVYESRDPDWSPGKEP